MTVLEVHDRKPYKIMDRAREVKKGVMAESLDELIERGERERKDFVNVVPPQLLSLRPLYLPPATTVSFLAFWTFNGL